MSPDLVQPTDASDTVPMIFDVDGMSAWLRERGIPPTPDELLTACCRLGRNDGPALLFDLHYSHLLTGEAATTNVARAWSSAEFPQRCLDWDTWSDLFDLAGYTVDGVRAVKPTEPIRLYRGAPEEGRGGAAWSADPEVARRFAEWIRGRRPGVVWTALVEPWRLLCLITGRQEDEYVVDTEGLVIELAR